MGTYTRVNYTLCHIFQEVLVMAAKQGALADVKYYLKLGLPVNYCDKVSCYIIPNT